MRAFEIFMLMACITAAFAVVNSIGIFPDNYVTPDSSLTEGMNLGNVQSQLDKLENPSVFDYFLLAGQFLADSFIFLILMLGRVAFFAGFLYSVFGVPLALAIALNVGLYIVVIIGILQFMSGRSVDQMR